MRKTLTMLLAGAALAAVGGAASAQTPYGGYGYGYGEPTATLYELPNFEGRSVVVRGQDSNLSGSGFNDRARSARFEGTWTVCGDAGFGGHCETLSGGVRFLSPGLSAAVSSLRATGGYGGGYPGGGYGYPGYPGSGTAILYEYPNFQGRSITVNGQDSNLSGSGFNDRARSARFEGTWRVCEDAGYGGRCETLSGSVPNLGLRIQGVSSLQMLGGYGGGYPYPGYPGYGQGVQGTEAVFYPGPAQGGYGAPYGSYNGTRRAAEDFCRQNGHRSVLWYGTSGGRLSDVLCRR